MAILLKGKNKGKQVKIEQFANNWLTITGEGGEPYHQVINPISVALSVDEHAKMKECKNCGLFWRIFIAYFDTKLMMFRLRKAKA